MLGVPRRDGARRAAWMAMLVLLMGLCLAVVARPAAAFDVKQADASVVRVLAFVVVDAGGGKVRPVAGGTGTGFVIDNEYVATNHHVVHIDGHVQKVPGGQPYFAIREPGQKANLKATVVWKSAELDLAIIKVPGLKRAALTLSNASPIDYPPRGAKVFTLGYPGISDQALQSEEAFLTSTLTQGVVGKTVRAAVGGAVRPVIQHDAAINEGNSGGPLLDNCNVVVGVNTFVAISRLKIMKDDNGADVAAGATASGVYLSPHVASLVNAVNTVPELKGIKLKLSNATDCKDEAAGVPEWAYGAGGAVGLLALIAVVLALTRRREVVRVVESYSAWVRRKGTTPGTPRTSGVRKPVGTPIPMPTSEPTMPGEMTSPPPRGRMDARPADPAVPASGDWVLSGFDAQGNTVRIALSGADFEKAMGGAEKGVIVGRSSSLADKLLADPSVSRRHLKFARLEDGTLELQDLNSAYGTKVNEDALVAFRPVPVRAGDKIALGSLVLDLSQMP